MAIGRLNYLDLDAGQRSKAAQHARQRYQQVVDNNPFLTAAQHAKLAAQLEQIAKWEQGVLAPPATATSLPSALRYLLKPSEETVQEVEEPSFDDF